VDSGEDIDMLAELVNLPDLQKYINEMNESDYEVASTDIDLSLLVEQDSMLISGPKSDMDGIKDLLKSIKGKMERYEKIHKIVQTVDGLDWFGDDGALLFIALAIAAHLTNSANKILIPCASFEQKMTMLGKLKDIIEHENLEGPFALGCACESILADYQA
jgi:hypothetical protein